MTMDMKSMVGALAGMPDDQRKTMMTERLNMFSEMGEDDRRNAMSMMTEAVGTLPESDIRKLVKTRTQILLDFPETKRDTLMKTHMGLLMGMPQERAMMEMKIIESIVPELTRPQQQMMQMMMGEMQKMMPMPAAKETPRSSDALARTFARDAATRAELPRLAGWATTLLWIVVAAGAWLIIAPFVLGYSGTTAALANDIVLGIGVAVLAGIVALGRPVE